MVGFIIPVSHLEEIWGHRFGELSDYKTTVTLNLAKIRNTYALLIIFWGHFFGRPKRLTALIFRLDSTLEATVKISCKSDQRIKSYQRRRVRNLRFEKNLR